MPSGLFRSARPACAVLFVAAVAACGLRSEGTGVLLCGEDDEAETGEEPRAGSCADPISLPPGEYNVNGRLGGCGDGEGWCGATGNEDYYLIKPHDSKGTDITIAFDMEETEFDPILRVLRDETADICTEPSVADNIVCEQLEDGQPAHTFLIHGPEDHYIVVDSQLGHGGDYSFTVRRNAADDSCKERLHPENIVIGTGGVFVWQDTLARGQGVLYGKCGGGGVEHIFQVELKGPGTLNASVTGEAGLEPVLSLRPANCVNRDERTCDNSTSAQGTSSISSEYANGKTVYLVVDQQSVEGGTYELTVSVD